MHIVIHNKMDICSFACCIEYDICSKQRITAITSPPKSKDIGFLSMVGMGAAFCSPREHMNVQVTEINIPDTKDICNINLTCVGELVKVIPFSTAGCYSN